MIETLEQARAHTLTLLTAAATDRRSPMHTPVVATSDADARIMVVRSFDADTWTLRFHTDVRAPKTAVLQADPRIGVLAYDREAKVQLRLRGSARILRDGPTVDAAWGQSNNFARRCYLGAGPGAPSAEPTSGLPPQFEGVDPDDDELAPARENFAVLLVDIAEIDWFSLAHTGHRRALLSRSGAEWITP